MRLFFLKKIAQDGETQTAIGDQTAVIPITKSELDNPSPSKSSVISEKWKDKFDPIDSKVIARMAYLGDKIKRIESMDRMEKLKHMRELVSLRDEWRLMSKEYNTISLNPETGTFNWGQSKEQEAWEISLLEKAGIKYPSYINRGVYSKVYKGILKGKSIIAKLTKSKSDVNTAQMIVTIRDSVPEKVSKHLIDILDIKQVEDSGINYYVIITESLVHANSHIRDLLSNLDLDTMEDTIDEGIETRKKSIENLLRSTDDVFESMIDNIVFDKMPDLKLNEEDKSKGKLTPGELLGQLLKTTIRLAFLTSNISETMLDARNKVKNILNETEYSANTIHEISNIFIDLVSELRSQVQLPSSTNDKTLKDKTSTFSALKAMPETSSFVNALLFLKKIGYKSIDLNRKNIMERPKTHDLVLADIGMVKPDQA